MRRFRPLTWLFIASALTLVTAGFVTTGPPVSTASAAPGDRWLEVNPNCCGDSGAFVGLAGAWSQGVEAVLEVDRLPLGDVNLTLTVTTPENFFIDAPLGVGDFVRVTAEGVIREVVIEPLTIQWILSDLDLVHGTAPEGRTVDVSANPYGPDQRTLTVGATGGEWTADFAGVFDIQEQDPSMPAPPAAQVGARMLEGGPFADGDAINHGHNAITPVVGVLPRCCGDQALVQTSGWRLGTLLTLNVLRGSTTLLHKSVTFTGFPQLTENNELAPLEVGDVVQVSAFGLTKEVVVVPLSITTVDPVTDTATGTAPAGATVDVTVIVPNVPGPSPAMVMTSADGSGLWAVSFAPAFDLLPTHQVSARVIDPERDTVGAIWFPPPISPWLTPSPDMNLTDGQTIGLAGGNWPANSTLYVSECRLDIGLSVDSCDSTTTQTFPVGPAGTVDGTYVVKQQLATGMGPYDCANGCGLVGVVWPGAPGVGNPQALDFPQNNHINFVQGTLQAITPATDLLDGESVTLRGEGLSPFVDVRIWRCEAFGDPDIRQGFVGNWCNNVDGSPWLDESSGGWLPAPAAYTTTTDADGTFEVTFPVPAVGSPYDNGCGTATLCKFIATASSGVSAVDDPEGNEVRLQFRTTEISWAYSDPFGPRAVMATSPTTTLSDVRVVNHVPPWPPAPDGVMFTLGVISFQVRVTTPGDAATVVIAPPTGTEAVLANAFYELVAGSGWTPRGAVGTDGVVTLSLVDGDADGVITVTGAPAIGLVAPPVVTVMPDTGLQNGQTVLVHGEGFGADQSVLVTQCTLTYPASERLCQRDPGYVDPQSFDDVAGVWVTTDAEGTFDAEYAVTALLPTWEFTGMDDPMWFDTTYNCLESGGCAIVAWQLDEQLTRAGAPITFAPWPDTGFEGKTKAPPAVNVVKAGSVVTVTFTVGGNRGLDIIAEGYPQSTPIACGTNPETTNGDPTRYQGKKTLSYNTDLDRYTYKWVTEGAWQGACRQLVIQLADGSYLRANFRFK